MKKITEKELMESAKLLYNKLSLIEAPVAQPSTQPNTDWSLANVGKAAGNIWQGVKNTANAVVGAPAAVGNALSNAGNELAAGFNSAQTPTTGAAAQSAWPTTPAAIKAFQQANGLTPDGAIGPKTMQALASKGIQPPAGFQMAGPKKATPAQAKPADIMAQTSDEAEDERIAQNQAFYNMTPDQQAMYNKGAPQQKQPAQSAPVGTQTPATAPNPNAAAITPNFASQQGTQPIAQKPPLSQEPVQVYKESVDPEMSRFRDIFSEDTNLQEVRDTSHVTFQQENSLARIVQLSRKH